MKNSIKLIFILFIIIVFIWSCKKDEEEDTSPDTPTIELNLGNDTTIINGTSIILDAGNPGATYIWSTGVNTQTLEVTTSGTYWVTVSKESVTKSDTINIIFQYELVRTETDFGSFLMWLYNQTSLHKNNFLSLTTQSFYDSLIFHRVINEFVIQGGDPEGTGYGGPGYTIPAEFVSEITHVYGAVGAARLADNVNPEKESNGSQFYIVDDNNGEHGLDGNYTVFGIVIDGMNVVEAISEVPVDTNNRPIENVYMNQVIIEIFTDTQLLNDYGFVIP
ncbi:MAG: peptidylprolyl isomerase [Bacteroidales bacterium]|nr:peptidylprolyl isomerase [Bacteroidales bacterium]